MVSGELSASVSERCRIRDPIQPLAQAWFSISLPLQAAGSVSQD
jgi:hypothetical protein